jgi:pyrimidine operon attenuation protein/uracil phosphoribosyltransferase
VHLAHRVKEIIKEIKKAEIPLGVLDITFYRDDLTAVGPAPVVKETAINFDINDKVVVLIDDVLFSGRTIRAALDQIADFGRPRRVELLVLVDRGHRELPIRADFVGKNIPTSDKEQVEVRLAEVDGQDEVVILEETT